MKQPQKQKPKTPQKYGPATAATKAVNISADDFDDELDV